jgi:hypothetical protein
MKKKLRGVVFSKIIWEERRSERRNENMIDPKNI